MNYLNREVHTIFVMLGNSCNLNCEYCLQHPLVNKALPKKISEDFYGFIRHIALNQECMPTLQFYGGEPLVYFDTIKEIVGKVNAMPDLKFNYSTISNGKLLNQEIVDFFNSNKFSVAISWDGRMSKNTRHFDVMQENNNAIYAINVLTLSGVVSNYAYPVAILNDFHKIRSIYKKKNNKDINVNLDLIMDTCIENKEILDLDIEKLGADYDFLFKNYQLSMDKKFDEVDKDYTVTHFTYARRMVNTARYNKERRSYLSSCGNGYDTINVDLEGNLYPCHNTSTSIGTVHSSYWDYLSNLIKIDNNLKNIDRCDTCEAVGMCSGGCKLLSDKVRENYYCAAKIEMIRAIKRNGVNINDG